MYKIVFYQKGECIGDIIQMSTQKLKTYKHEWTAQRTIDKLKKRFVLKDGDEFKIERVDAW